jgi:3-hydroxyacyl-[acyl-carrier-protein] dehydratase
VIRWPAKEKKTNRNCRQDFVSMQFSLIDRILELEEGSHIKAVKALSMAEEYLKDHFPRFPCMPGVLMVESMFQASAWLIRKSENFSNSMVVLKEIRNLKCADFVAPGQSLVVSAEILKQDDTTTTLKTQGTVNDSLAVAGRLVVERYNLADRHPERELTDNHLRIKLQRQYAILWPVELVANEEPDEIN